MTTTGICAGARAGQAAHGHPKTAQSHRNRERRCYCSPLPLCIPPSLLPLVSGTPNTASLSWYCNTRCGCECMATSNVHIRATHSSLPLASSLYLQGCSSTAYLGKLVNTKIITLYTFNQNAFQPLFHIFMCSTV